LTEESHGNAIGIGLADYATQRLVDKIDLVATSTNAIAAVTPEKGRIPIALKTDRESVETAFTTIREVDPEKARVVHIKNTLEIAELDVSEALLEEVKGKENLRLKKELGPISFDSHENLQPVLLDTF
ncbi:MAG: hypothetical protein IMF11_13090, partial [Proteobacteria bacterium]|nr:hypothetical protein [Pseudomonadota bacterium]